MTDIVVRGDLIIHVVEGKALLDKDTDLVPFLEDLSDPWVELVISGQQILVTTTEVNSVNPKWNARAVVPLCYTEDFVSLKVWDDDYIGKNLIGEAIISLQPVSEPWNREEWVQLKAKAGAILINMSFTPFKGFLTFPEKEPLNLDCLYFPPRKGGLLQLYHDAHAQEISPLPKRTLPDNKNTFDDIAEALEKAQKIIYISGWSLWTELHLKRDGDMEETLGEILKRRAEDGIRVLILIWNEKFSAKLCKELFGTHSTKTVEYFKGTGVTAIAVRRMSLGESKLTNVLETIYTHHMKMVIADSPETGLVGFIGGMDLTDGRWDTPEHSLWETLKNLHSEDFYNGFLNVSKDTGPREPYHDVHSRVEGLVVCDMLRIFEERCTRQVSNHVNLLVPISEEEIFNRENAKDGRIWHTQALRCSDTDSSMFDPKIKNVTDVKHKQKDASITHGLIALIRSCKKFIYIESQYFLGSAFMWETYKDTCAPNTVALEIAEQISFSIKKQSPIRVYILLPMCPEGNPTTKIGACYMNQILQWQFLTIKMMYSRIAATLKEVGSSDHPEDFLVFLTLGQKLEKKRAARSFPFSAMEGSEASKWQQKSRFLIYVHSKMALVDDARVLIGSANFNQRSLDGTRDTEAAIAGSQVDYDGEKQNLVTDGEVSHFRRSLWYEHTNGLSETDPTFHDPSSKECITAIRTKAHQSLMDYVNDYVDKDTFFRYMKYPLQVDAKGNVSTYPNMTKLPDFDLLVEGKTGFIPPNVTT